MTAPMIIQLRWRNLLSLVLAAACAGLLSSCASSGSNSGLGGRDLVTASDQTDKDRLAATLMELAGMYFGRGDRNTALDEVKKVIAVKPDMAGAYNLRGLIYASMDEHRLAEDSFLRSLQVNAQDADAMHNYGWFLCQQRRFPEADAKFRRALTVAGYTGGSRSLLAQGVCLARAGRMAEAESTLGHAYEADPANPTTAVNLAEVLYRRGEFERARFYVRRVNSVPEFVSAQTLWLAARIENKLGQPGFRAGFGHELKNRFPLSPEAALYEKGRFDE
jgi:type IV pilus assembly protein PilF